MADGSPAGERAASGCCRRYADRDDRVKYLILGENKGISGNTNAAMDMASGDFILLADHDDTLTPNALYEVAKAINADPLNDVIYSDEDKLDMDGGALFEPHFKPDFDPDLLTSTNYICHPVRGEPGPGGGGGAVRRGGLTGPRTTTSFSGARRRPGKIHHIPKVLYHWRCHQGSTASNPESKLYAFEAGARAIQAHFDRLGIGTESIEKGVDYGKYHVRFADRGGAPGVGDHPQQGPRRGSGHLPEIPDGEGHLPNLEYVIIENNSTDPETFAYYEKLKKEHPNVKVVTWEREFNYSAINNCGVKYADGEYFLFLNNDTEISEPDTIQEMLGYCQREDVGAVGARLLYQDDTIQHAGVVVGFGGIAGHTFIGLHKSENSYFHRAMCAQDYSAVTAACMMTKRQVFERAGGFSEELAVAFNDIDYCMKVRAQDKLVVYNPYALLYHYESKSRGLEDTPEKVARFNREIKIFSEKWPDILKNGDPYYNPNLTLRKSNFALRDLKKEKIGEPYPLEI